MSYEPRPGSVPDRVIAHLRTLPHGAERLSSQLADAINAPPAHVVASLEGAVNAGALFRRKKDSHVRAPVYWSLVDHQAAKGTTPPHANGAHVEPPAPAAAPPAPAAPDSIPLIAFAHERQRRPQLKQVERPAQTPVNATGLRIALWSDGALVIERGPHLVASLTAEETRLLVKYLDKVLLEREEAA
jgi:hypothetical protein